MLLAWVSVRLGAGRVTLARELPHGRMLEGDDVEVALEAQLGGRLPASSVSVHEVFGGVPREAALLRAGARHRGGYRVHAVPRGRYAAAATTVVVSDPFGLVARAADVPPGAAAIVYPRLAHLETLFSDTGSLWWDGRRLLLRRAAGFELHTVRDYERGDSLRAVHWRSTAKRGELMVKELEDSPRADVAVVLDCHAVPALGARPDTPFDAAVRAAGSLLAAHVRRGRTASLVLNGRAVERLAVAPGTAWDGTLERLAAVEADGRRDVAASVEQTSTAQIPEVTVVTAILSPRLTATLVARAAARRRVSLVLIDAASFAGAAQPRGGDLLRLAAAGVPVAVVGRGDDLRRRLAAPALAANA